MLLWCYVTGHNSGHCAIIQFSLKFFSTQASKNAHGLCSNKKKKSCRRDEANALLWSMGQQSIIYFADVCNLSSRQNNHTVVAALGKGYQEAHKSWWGLKARNIHLLNLVKAILESQGLEHREHAVLCRDKMCQEFLRLLSVSIDLPFASQQNIILKLI